MQQCERNGGAEIVAMVQLSLGCAVLLQRRWRRSIALCIASKSALPSQRACAANFEVRFNRCSLERCYATHDHQRDRPPTPPVPHSLPTPSHPFPSHPVRPRAGATPRGPRAMARQMTRLRSRRVSTNSMGKMDQRQHPQCTSLLAREFLCVRVCACVRASEWVSD